MKRCYACETELPVEDFHKDSSRGDGLNHRCKKCHHDERAVRNSRKLKKADKYLISDRSKVAQIKYSYKLSEEQFVKMMANGCEVCGSYTKLVIDHDHSCCSSIPTCGRCVRGVLCWNCNVAEGHLRGNVETVKALLNYLEKYLEKE